MRIRSDIFVTVLTRRVFSAGGFAAVEHKGAEEAGAVFVRHRHRDGTETLYGPAPQNVFDEEVTERRFEKRLDNVGPAEIDALIERERSFDRDLWLIELDVDDVDGLFAVVDARP
ncbi:hypothetical protein ABID21_000091 [Pseudorhizobium tarimense]|uniref:DUF1491 family protein n=1 Tax=Pseudorhizobium tarimense TaxID=1079109 RepID=A0ABV2H0F5_9HYPH|nr:DUF1491 family protein [Pseudorhizobium tarimense]MCJ8517343.1 DUF1491 family protein [Pseudorhizobium tarimense]